MTTNVQTAAATETTATKLTKLEKLQARVDLLTKRIAEDTAALPLAEAELKAQQQIAEVKEGSVIQIKQGRAETLRTVNAKVLASKVDEDGSRLFRVEVGEGFEAEVVIVRDYQVIGVVSL